MTQPTSAASPLPRPQGTARLTLRIVWIAVQVLTAFFFAQQGELFFYQGF